MLIETLRTKEHQFESDALHLAETRRSLSHECTQAIQQSLLKTSPTLPIHPSQSIAEDKLHINTEQDAMYREEWKDTIKGLNEVQKDIPGVQSRLERVEMMSKSVVSAALNSSS